MWEKALHFIWLKSADCQFPTLHILPSARYLKTIPDSHSSGGWWFSLQPEPASGQATPDIFAAGKYTGRCRVFSKSLQEYLGPQRASVPSVTARIRGRRAWREVKRKREKEQLKLLLPKGKFISCYHRAAPAYLLHCQSWFSLTQDGLGVFHTIRSTTQPTAAEINPIYFTFLGLSLTSHITYPDGEKQKRKARCLGEKAENRSSLTMSLMHHVCKRARRKCPKALSKKTPKPKPKRQTGTLWCINSRTDRSVLDFMGGILAIWDL